MNELQRREEDASHKIQKMKQNQLINSMRLSGRVRVRVCVSSIHSRYFFFLMNDRGGWPNSAAIFFSPVLCVSVCSFIAYVILMFNIW